MATIQKEAEQIPGAWRRAINLWIYFKRLPFGSARLSDNLNNQAIEEASDVVARFFKRTRLRFSQVGIAFQYLYNSSEEDTNKGGGEIVQTTPLESKPFKWLTIALIKQCALFARAIYDLTENKNSKCRCTGKRPHIILKNCLRCQNKMFRRSTAGSNFALEQKAKLNNKEFKVPYLVAISRKPKIIVISIRGTVSSYDKITNMAVGLATVSDGKDFKAHRGMVIAAKEILKRVYEDLCPFEKLGYVFITTGHSLGAGVAAILATSLQEYFPGKVRCVAICPPGWVVSHSLANHSKHFCVSIVHGHDIVSRLCPQIDMDSVVESINDLLWTIPYKRNISIERTLPFILRSTAFFSRIWDTIRRQKRTLVPECEDLFIPGQIIHMDYEDVVGGEDPGTFAHIGELSADSLRHHKLSAVIEGLKHFQ